MHLGVVGNMDGSDKIMNNALFLGTYPGLTDSQIEFVIKVIRDYADNKQNRL